MVERICYRVGFSNISDSFGNFALQLFIFGFLSLNIEIFQMHSVFDKHQGFVYVLSIDAINMTEHVCHSFVHFLYDTVEYYYASYVTSASFSL